MAQLSDDCFAFGGALLPVSEMERLIAERVVPVTETETVPLAAARGRVVAQDVLAPIDLPPFDNSAVDGFAVRHADLAATGDTRLKVVDRITAGKAATRALGAGEAIRIFTGAPMPAGADTVFMQEDTRVEGDTVVVPPGLKRGANSRAAGEDLRAKSVDAAGRPAAHRRRMSRSPPPSGLPNCWCAAACGSRCSRPATRSSNPASRCRRPRCSTPTASCSPA